MEKKDSPKKINVNLVLHTEKEKKAWELIQKIKKDYKMPIRKILKKSIVFYCQAFLDLDNPLEKLVDDVEKTEMEKRQVK